MGIIEISKVIIYILAFFQMFYSGTKYLSEHIRAREIILFCLISIFSVFSIFYMGSYELVLVICLGSLMISNVLLFFIAKKNERKELMEILNDINEQYK